jgi:hypothetical protein
MNMVPHVIVEANNYTALVGDLLVIVAEGEECDSLLVSVVVFINVNYMRVRFAIEDRLLIEV